jgi:uroporphyrinogen decarboxylase
MDGAILFSDILVVPDALGAEVSFVEGEGPKLTPIRNRNGLVALDRSGVSTHLGPVYETVERVVQELPEKAAMIGFAGAPWTVATYMVEGGSSRDFATTKGWALSDPEGFQELIDLLVDASVEYLIGQVCHGVEAVQIFDSWAGVLPEREFQRWCVAPARAMVDGLRAVCPHVPIIGFPRGAGVMVGDYVNDTGIDAIGIDSAMSVTWAARELQSRCTVQGNLDPICLLTGGERMDEDITAILEALGRGPFVFNLGHGIVPATPPDNVTRLVETVRAWTA